MLKIVLCQVMSVNILRDTNNVIRNSYRAFAKNIVANLIYKAPSVQFNIVVQYIQNFLDLLSNAGILILALLITIAIAYFLVRFIRHPPEPQPFLFQLLDPVIRVSVTIVISGAIGASIGHFVFQLFLNTPTLYYPTAGCAGLGAVIGFYLWRRFRVGGDAEV